MEAPMLQSGSQATPPKKESQVAPRGFLVRGTCGQLRRLLLDLEVFLDGSSSGMGYIW